MHNNAENKESGPEDESHRPTRMPITSGVYACS